jgi:hypothetical protein
MFEKATRLHLRFPHKGLIINVEDLWDLPVEALDSIYSSLNRERKSLHEESLLNENKDNKILNLQIEVVRHIVTVKLDEDRKEKDAIVKKERIKKIDEIIEKKENFMMEQLTVAELKEMKNSL